MELINEHISFTKSLSDIKKPTLYPFQNRRTSRYLKGVFPAGFNSSHIKNDLSQLDCKSHLTPNDIVRLSKSMSTTGQQPQIENEYKSFTSWTKGDSSVVNNVTTQYEGDLYLDVAGPFFRDSTNAYYVDRRDPDQQGPFNVNADGPLSIRHVTSSDRKSKSAHSTIVSPTHDNIYLPTAVLPVIIPQHPMLRSATRKNANRQSKGKKSVPMDEIVAPHLLPQFLVLELLRYRDIQSSQRISEELMMGTRIKVPSSCTFVLLKMQIRHMFDTEDSGAGALEMNYYNNALEVWRPLSSKEDWAAAKLIALERQEQLKVLFAFGKQAELVEGLMSTPTTMRRAVSSNVSRSGDQSIGGRLSRTSGGELASFHFHPMKSQPISYLPNVKPSTVAFSPTNASVEPSLEKQLKFGQVLEQRLMLSRAL